jgi:hypothetical protein
MARLPKCLFAPVTKIIIPSFKVNNLHLFNKEAILVQKVIKQILQSRYPVKAVLFTLGGIHI